MKIFSKGLATGLLLQLAIGPVFFFIMNLCLQKTLADGLAAVIGVTLVDYFYIMLAIFGVGEIIKREKVKRILSVIGPLVLIGFGVHMMWGALFHYSVSSTVVESGNVLTSFTAAFMLTFLSPMTIFFWTGFFATKAVESGYTRRELIAFGLSTGLATLIFLGSTVIIIHYIKEAFELPILVFRILNVIVSGLLLVYGGVRLMKAFKSKK